MSYFAFLLRFLVLPIVILLLVTGWERRQGRQRVASLNGWPVWAAIVLHCLIALLYTTPWDNYLVASGVWWYDPALVSGVTIGWVPIEEYTFFVLQPVLAGLWLAFLARRIEPAERLGAGGLRLWLPALLALAWLAAAAVLAAGWQPGVYLALILVWALPPIGLQLAFGADILWQQRRLLLPAFVSLTLYLGAADALAIREGTWTIDPAQSLGLYLGGVLPIEEFLFFAITNMLLLFGVTLLWAGASHERLASLRRRAADWRGERRLRTVGAYSSPVEETRSRS